MKKILYIDMDGVIVDYHSAKPSQEDIKKYGSDDNVPGLYKKMKSMPNAIEAVQKLSEYYDIYILSTAPWDNTSAWSDKLDWVKKYLPFMKKRLILSHNKQLNIGDYLIDDRPHKNGAGEFGETCYGELLHFGKDGEYKDWQAVLDYLLKEENYKKQASNNKTESNYNPNKDLSNYKMPTIELLKNHNEEYSKVTTIEIQSNKDKIVQVFKNYRIKIDKINTTIGPVISLYEITLSPGVKISKLRNLQDDIELSLSYLNVRIIMPLSGKETIGIEIPNKKKKIVSMREVISSKNFKNTKYDLPIALGKTVSNETFIFDLANSPNILIAGTTGQGKTVSINAILTSLLYKKNPAQLKFVLIDPKVVELSIYSKIEEHYLAKLPNEEKPIVTDNEKIIDVLNSLIIEMDNRYELLKNTDVKNITEYNNKIIKPILNPNKEHDFLPYIVLVIDEFASLITNKEKDFEIAIASIAQLGRAVGIHTIIATQNPSTNIITGVFKANIPTRIAFRVSSSIESRTILDHNGANKLIGHGDLLINNGYDMTRVQCAFIDTPEIKKLTKFISEQQGLSSSFELPKLNNKNNKEKEYQSFDDEVYKIWNILPPIMQLDYTASDVDKVVHHISNLIDINHFKYHDAKLEFDKIFDYVEDQLFVCYGNFETEFVEEVIRMYNQVNKFYEEEEE